MTPDLPFEGPEKKLFVAFTGKKSPGLRSMSQSGLNAILAAASCSVISVTRNPHVDAYLLSESSLFISDSSFMIKTCGSTTLLRALPFLLSVAARLGLHPTTVQYSRVQFCFPERQLFPHDSYANEVAYLDRVLQFTGRPFQLGASSSAADWNVYIAQLEPQAPLALQQTLEVFMFDLDPAAMTHYFHHRNPERGGTESAIGHTTVRSGISALLKDDSKIDAYNFLPCGYSLNAIHDHAYYTIHVSPEPDASYVSFETTVDTADLAGLVAAVVKVFRPGRFTVAYLGTADAAGLRENPKAPVHWLTLSKLLASQFAPVADPALVQATASIWATVATYKRRAHTDGMKPEALMAAEVSASKGDTVLDKLVSRFDNVHYVPSDDVRARARAAIARLRDVERPTFVVDLGELYRRAAHVQNALHSQFSLRYATRCNSDPAVLALLGLLGWSFEAVSVAEVRALRDAGIKRENIVFTSPLLTPAVIARLGDFGVISLFSAPGEKLRRAIKDANVAVEVRVPIGAVEETVAICKDVLTVQRGIHSLALDCDPNVYLLEADDIQANLYEGVRTLREVMSALPPAAVENTGVSVGELFPICRENRLEAHSKELTEMFGQFASISFDPGRWMVGRCTSLLTSVIGRRVRNATFTMEEGEKGADEQCAATEERHNYFLNDGVYGAFSFVVMERSAQNRARNRVPEPQVIYRAMRRSGDQAGAQHDRDPFPFTRDSSVVSSDEECAVTKVEEGTFPSTLFGPTCDSLDQIWMGLLPKLDIGDMLLFSDMGAYAASAVSSFNGFAKKFDTLYVVGPDTGLSGAHLSDGSSE